MCGIIGYVGTNRVLPILTNGLENLEYRGYDSAGIALNGKELTVYKKEGEVEALREILPKETPHTLGIGHTRWSTHGPPTDVNAHPHTDESEAIAVVHNGIIENYDHLKSQLSGHSFTSETDTEVVPHLLEDELHRGSDPQSAIKSVVSQLAGSFALVITIAGDDRIFAIRRDSPLVIGYTNHGSFVASDATAFIEQTNEVTFLEDGQLAILDKKQVHISDNGSKIDPEIQQLEWEPDAAEKAGYEHYMRKEIHEQPRALRQTITGRLKQERSTVSLDLAFTQSELTNLDEIQFVACGTSRYAGEYAASLLSSIADIRTSVEIASEYSFTGGRDPNNVLTVAVTQSGETADTLGAIRTAKQAGASTLAITNTLGSTITREVDDSLFIRAGPEIGVAATKTFASQVATMTLFGVAVGRARDVLHTDQANRILQSVRGLPGAVQQILDRENTVKEIAHEYANSDGFFFIGRNLACSVSLEGALKLKEISYDHAEGFAAGELKHGPLALVTENTPVLAVLTAGANPEATLNNVKEVQARDAPVIGATSFSRSEPFLDEVLPIPELGIMEPLLANVYWQLFAYHIANYKDRPIDKPRNLAKSVTVE